MVAGGREVNPSRPAAPLISPPILVRPACYLSFIGMAHPVVIRNVYVYRLSMAGLLPGC